MTLCSYRLRSTAGSSWGGNVRRKSTWRTASPDLTVQVTQTSDQSGRAPIILRYKTMRVNKISTLTLYKGFLDIDRRCMNCRKVVTTPKWKYWGAFLSCPNAVCVSTHAFVEIKIKVSDQDVFTHGYYSWTWGNALNLVASMRWFSDASPAPEHQDCSTDLTMMNRVSLLRGPIRYVF